MKQTAIEQLIEELKKRKSLYSQSRSHEERIAYRAYNNAIYEAEKMLPIEKQNIVYAAADAFLGSMHEEGAKQIGENYFKNTFKK